MAAWLDNEFEREKEETEYMEQEVKKTKFQAESAKRYRCHARLKKKGYKVVATQRTVYSTYFPEDDKDLNYLKSHGYNLQLSIV